MGGGARAGGGVLLRVLGAVMIATAACGDAHDHGGRDAGAGGGSAGAGDAGAGGAAAWRGGALARLARVRVAAAARAGCVSRRMAVRAAFRGCPVSGPLPGGVSLTGVWIGPAGEVWAVGGAGYVGRRAPETGAWCWCVPLPSSLNAVWGAGNNVFAVGDAGVLVRFDGTRWLRDNVAFVNLRAVHGTASDNVWAVGQFGTALRFDGIRWFDESAGPQYALGAVWVDPTGVVHIAGRGPLPDPDPYNPTFNVEAAFLRRAPGGVAWEIEGSVPQRGGIDVLVMRGTSATDIWAGGINYPSGAATGYGGIFRFDGATWVADSGAGDLLASNYIMGIAPSSPAGGATLFTGSGGQGISYDGTSYAAAPELNGATNIDVRGAEMYAVGAYGLVLRWTAQSGWTVDRAAVGPLAITSSQPPL